MNPPADWILNTPLSKAVLEGQIGQGHDVVEKPDMTRLIYSTENSKDETLIIKNPQQRLNARPGWLGVV